MKEVFVVTLGTLAAGDGTQRTVDYMGVYDSAESALASVEFDTYTEGLVRVEDKDYVALWKEEKENQFDEFEYVGIERKKVNPNAMAGIASAPKDVF